MKKLLLSFLFIGGLNATAQTTLFEDSFETHANFLINSFGDWSGIDVDLLNTYGVGTGITWDNNGDPQSFMVFNPSATTPPVTNATTGVGGETENRNFDPRTGAKYAACWASVPSTTGGAVANNDWLISPPITLGSTGNELRFWVKSMSNSYGLEKYRVAIYVGSGVPLASDFVYLAGNPVALTATYPDWSERVVALSATYDNATVRFGIQCVTADAYMFMVDDFKVTTTGLSNSDFNTSKFSVYPNPANNVVTITNTQSILVSEVAITDVNGRTIKTIKVDNLSEVELNVSELTSGIYFMNLTTDTGKVVKKFVKS